MNSVNAIVVANLSKEYRIYFHPVDSILELILGKSRHIKKSALDNINLTVKRGEIVGILGRNGAGKSTLLKLIAGTLRNYTGEIEVNGRISAILELGTGFHPEYTGRENIYMGGFCMGMSRSQINTRLDQIVDFSELKDVIDMPFKTYSTGMQARLTFSTAISVEPDVLIVDEALSVGDANFQKKCATWMKGLRDKDATILLVTHDTNTITSLCDSAIIIEKGRVYSYGEPKKITEDYQNLLFGNIKNSERLSDSQIEQQRSHPEINTLNETQIGSAFNRNNLVRYGNEKARVESWSLIDGNGNTIQSISSGASFKLVMQVVALQTIEDVSCGFAIKDKRGTVIWGMTNISSFGKAISIHDGECIEVSVTGQLWLAAGEYFVTLGIAHDGNGEKIDFIEDAIRFNVTGTDAIFTTSIVNLQTDFNIDKSG